MDKLNELNLIEQPAIELFQSLEYTHQNCFHETFGEHGALGRAASTDVVLIPKLKESLIKLNPSLPDEAIDLAIEELTRKTFGNYVSIYNFKQSIDDNATVPLYYENRIPEVQLKNEYLNEDIEQIIEEAMLSPEQEEKLQREFTREYHIITRDDRLEKSAEDIVAHFVNRGY